MDTEGQRGLLAISWAILYLRLTRWACWCDILRQKKRVTLLSLRHKQGKVCNTTLSLAAWWRSFHKLKDWRTYRTLLPSERRAKALWLNGWVIIFIKIKKNKRINSKDAVHGKRQVIPKDVSFRSWSLILIKLSLVARIFQALFN